MCMENCLMVQQYKFVRCPPLNVTISLYADLCTISVFFIQIWSYSFCFCSFQWIPIQRFIFEHFSQFWYIPGQEWLSQLMFESISKSCKLRPLCSELGKTVNLTLIYCFCNSMNFYILIHFYSFWLEYPYHFSRV